MFGCPSAPKRILEMSPQLTLSSLFSAAAMAWLCVAAGTGALL